MEITDKDQAAVHSSNFYTFIRLLDENGVYITGVAVASNRDDVNLQVMFPGSTMVPADTEGEFDVAVRLPKVKVDDAV